MMQPKRGATGASSSSGPSPRVIAGIVVGIAVVLALVAVLLRSGTDGSASDTTAEGSVEIGSVRIEGQTLVPHVEGPSDAGTGARAPQLVGTGFDGQPLSIAPGTEPMVVVFVAHWCPHCQAEVPLLAAWASGGVRNGVAVRAVSTSTTSERPNYPPSAWLAREGFTIPTLADDAKSSAASAYGLTSFPYFVAMDAKGNVVARVSGELTEAQFDDLVAKTKA